MNVRLFLLAAFVTTFAAPSMAQIANTATGSSSASPLLLGNNAGKGGPTSSGKTIQPYTNYTSTASSGSEHESIAQLMAENSQGMADTGAKFASERAQAIAAQQARENAQLQAASQTGEGGAVATPAPTVVLQYTPPSTGTGTAPPRTFHIE